MARRTIREVDAQLAAAMARIEELQAQLNQPNGPKLNDYRSQRAYVQQVATRAGNFYGPRRVFQSIKNNTIGVVDMSGKTHWGPVERMDAHLTAKGL